MSKLSQLRKIIATLDETLVTALCNRSQFRMNRELYKTDAECLAIDLYTARFCSNPTIAGRIQIITPLYVNEVLPSLTIPGSDVDQRKCITTDTSCLSALVQRLNLSLHVIALKAEEIPDTLREPLSRRDPIALETAITNQQVENEVFLRILSMSQSIIDNQELSHKITAIYKNWIIPLSRKIQVYDLIARYKL